jgi:hypothetical protein
MRLLLFSLLILASSCMTGSKTASMKNEPATLVTKYDSLQFHKGKTVILEGIMQMEKFVNKRGDVGDFYEFWLEMDGKNKVKLRNAGDAISKEPFTRKVHIQGVLFYGNIDSDDPKVQSRVGYRLDFNKITILKE